MLIERYLYCASGIRHTRHQVLEAVLLEGLDGLLGEFVLAQCTDGDGVVTAQEGTAQFLTFGEDIPQGLAQAHYITFVHILV